MSLVLLFCSENIQFVGKKAQFYSDVFVKNRNILNKDILFYKKVYK